MAGSLWTACLLAGCVGTPDVTQDAGPRDELDGAAGTSSEGLIGEPSAGASRDGETALDAGTPGLSDSIDASPSADDDAGEDAPDASSAGGHEQDPQLEGACATDNGGCDSLTTCEIVDDQVVCGACPEGYAGSGEAGCGDIDECARAQTPCAEHTLCTNLVGGYACGCLEGFEDVAGDGSECVDIDECETDNGGCDPLTECVNVPGGRECAPCREGFRDEGSDGATQCVLEDPSLDGLEVSAALGDPVLDQAFDPSTLEYEVELPLSAGELTVTALLPGDHEGHARIVIASQEEEVEGADATLPIPVGESDVEVRVTTDGGVSRTYTLLVTRFPEFEAYVKASNTDAGDRFGYRVAISGDGQTMAIGAPFQDGNGTGANASEQGPGAREDSGAVYVFVRGETRWLQQSYLKATNNDAGDRFGFALALSDDGDTLVASAVLEGGCATGVVPADDTAAQASNDCPSAGAVYVFERSGAIWSATHYLKPASPQGAMMGSALALSGDGNTIVAGAPTAPSCGAAYAFDRAGTNWLARDALMPPAAGGSCRFGTAVAISENGETIAVAWAIQGVTVIHEDGVPHVIDVRTGDGLEGSLLAISGDGRTLAVGEALNSSASTGISPAPASDTGAPQSGAVHVFARVGTGWSREAYIKASNAQENDRLGVSVALARDGDVLVVGARGEDGSRRGVFRSADANDGAQDSGAVYVFRRSDSQWREDGYVKASNTDPNDHFGVGVALSGDGNRLVVGADGERSNATGVDTTFQSEGQQDNGPEQAGAAYVYY